MNWSGSKVLVTGADGFIGSHLAERLVALGADVRAFCLYNSNGSWGWLDGAELRGQAAPDVAARGHPRRAVRGGGLPGRGHRLPPGRAHRHPLQLHGAGVLPRHQREGHAERARGARGARGAGGW